MSEFKKTIKHASIYAAGVLIGRLVSFIMLPIYTRYLTTSDYGVLELLMMTADIVSLIIGIGITNGIFKFYYQYSDQTDKNAVISTAFQLVIVLYSIAALISIINSAHFSNLLFGSQQYNLAIKLVFAALLFQICTSITMTFFRAQQKPLPFVIINIIRLVIQLSLNIYFIVFRDIGVMGAVYADFITSLIFGLTLSVYTFSKVGFNFHKTKANAMIKFGMPFILTNIGAFILTFSDRYFIKYFWDLNKVGIYSLGYKIGFILSFIITRPFNGIWEAQRFEVIKQKNAVKVINKTLNFYSFLVISGGLALSIFSRDLFRIMSAPEFWNAYFIVPLIALSYIIQGLTGFINLGIYHKEKTYYITYSTIFAVITILILSVLLIPSYGAYGAAVATLFAFIVRFIFIYFYSQKIYYIAYRFHLPFYLFLLALTIYFLYEILIIFTPIMENIWVSLTICILLMFIYLSSIIVFKILPDKEKNEIVDKIIDRFQFLSFIKVIKS